MLTVDLVRARRKKGELQLLGVSPALESAALAVTQELLAIASEGVGRARDEVAIRWREVTCAMSDRKLADGLLKLVEDRCEFGSENAERSQELRASVFTLATERRRQHTFAREPILQAIGDSSGLSVEHLEQALYADLRGAECLRRAPNTSAEVILSGYLLAQQQAVLLRAVRIEVRIRCHDPSLYRLVFQKLKFRRLLFEVEVCEGGYLVTIDGPYSLFESVTKYGLALALSLPVFLACDGVALRAQVRWGPAREPLDFWIRHDRALERAELPEPVSEVDMLVAAFERLDSGWRVERTLRILNLPGTGVCVPDLTFLHLASGERILFELMGYWSREAVFRRLDLAARGAGGKLLFAVSEKLRVSEAVAQLEEGAALYVFKRTLNARAVLEKLEALRAAPTN